MSDMTFDSFVCFKSLKLFENMSDVVVFWNFSDSENSLNK